MANLNESDLWEAGIYQLEEDDPVLGGPTGIDNLAPRQLASRSRFQRLRNVTPWDAALTYPANVAYVSHGGTTWKSTGESTNVVPGSDVTKWVRWAHTAEELGAALGNAVDAHEAEINPHAQYVRHDAPQGLSASKSAQARANIDAEKSGIAVATIQTNSPMYAVATGSANAVVVTYAPAIPSLTDGAVLWFKAAAANTGAATLNVNGLGVKPILGLAHSALQGGEIVANGKCQVIWNASLNAFVLLACTGGALQVPVATQSGHAVNLGQFAGIKTSSGYQRLAGGLIMQWGSTAAAAQGSYVRTTLPLAFPNANLMVVVSPIVSGVNTNNYTTGAVSLTLTSFDMTNNSAGSGPVSGAYVAIGY